MEERREQRREHREERREQREERREERRQHHGRHGYGNDEPEADNHDGRSRQGDRYGGGHGNQASYGSGPAARGGYNPSYINDDSR